MQRRLLIAFTNGFKSQATLRSMSTATSNSNSLIDVERQQYLLKLQLNRPKALNALSLEMCDDMKSILSEQINKNGTGIHAFLLKGAGGKAFCAGGDVKSIYMDLLNCENNNMKDSIGTGKFGLLHNDFFRIEYTMNYMLGTTDVPQISLWDGIVMGGGVGLSVLGEFRIATENTVFAMPETGVIFTLIVIAFAHSQCMNNHRLTY